MSQEVAMAYKSALCVDIRNKKLIDNNTWYATAWEICMSLSALSTANIEDSY